LTTIISKKNLKNSKEGIDINQIQYNRILKNSQITITKKQANIAFGLCIDNVNSFINDIEILLQENKFDHIIIHIQFAMEELGKAKILLEKINKNSSDKIILSKNDGWLDHEKKVEIASELIDIPSEQKELLGLLIGDDPEGFPPDFLTEVIMDSEVEELKDKAKQGHSLRLESSFVGFDKESGDPILRNRLPKEEVEMFLQILSEGLMKIKADYIQ